MSSFSCVFFTCGMNLLLVLENWRYSCDLLSVALLLFLHRPDKKGLGHFGPMLCGGIICAKNKYGEKVLQNGNVELWEMRHEVLYNCSGNICLLSLLKSHDRQTGVAVSPPS